MREQVLPQEWAADALPAQLRAGAYGESGRWTLSLRCFPSISECCSEINRVETPSARRRGSRGHDGEVSNDAAPVPPLSELLASAHVVALPLAARFRGIDVREAIVFEGPEGWTEFSPFGEYDDTE